MIMIHPGMNMPPYIVGNRRYGRQVQPEGPEREEDEPHNLEGDIDASYPRHDLSPHGLAALVGTIFLARELLADGIGGDQAVGRDDGALRSKIRGSQRHGRPAQQRDVLVQ